MHISKLITIKLRERQLIDIKKKKGFLSNVFKYTF